MQDNHGQYKKNWQDLPRNKQRKISFSLALHALGGLQKTEKKVLNDVEAVIVGTKVNLD